MSPEILTLLMFGLLLLLIATGMYIFLALAFVGVVFALVTIGLPGLFIAGTVLYSQWSSLPLLAIIYFFFMATTLRYSGIADGLYDTLHHWLGGLRGGLASATVVVCTIFAAMVGISGAATISMGLIALPAMLQRRYNKDVAVGCVMAGGVLGIIIPPSVIMILYSFMIGISVVRLYFAGFVPGILIATLFVIYITIRAYIQPNFGPALPPEERVSLREKVALLKYLVLPIILIITVLGVIYGGVCTPTEAGAIGGVGALLCAIVYRRLSPTMLKNAARDAFMLAGFCLWIVALASFFNNIYLTTGARETFETLILGLEVNRWVIIIAMQASLFVFGCVMDDYAIVMLVGPIYAPIVYALGFDPVWWGMIFLLNMQIAYLTPPYGFNLFYMKGIIPQIRSKIPVDISMLDIYRSAIPFVLIQTLGLILTMIFPQICLWLPRLIK